MASGDTIGFLETYFCVARKVLDLDIPCEDVRLTLLFETSPPKDGLKSSLSDFLDSDACLFLCREMSYMRLRNAEPLDSSCLV